MRPHEAHRRLAVQIARELQERDVQVGGTAQFNLATALSMMFGDANVDLWLPLETEDPCVLIVHEGLAYFVTVAREERGALVRTLGRLDGGSYALCISDGPDQHSYRVTDTFSHFALDSPITLSRIYDDLPMGREYGDEDRWQALRQQFRAWALAPTLPAPPELRQAA